MTRKKQSEKNESVVDLGQKIGLTLLNDATTSEVSDWLPTEIPQLDSVIGGGIPFGRVTEVYGKLSSGWTQPL